MHFFAGGITFNGSLSETIWFSFFCTCGVDSLVERVVIFEALNFCGHNRIHKIHEFELLPPILMFSVIGANSTLNLVNRWQNLSASLLYFLVRVRCRYKESSRLLSHLLMSFLYNMLLFIVSNCKVGTFLGCSSAAIFFAFSPRKIYSFRYI